MQENYRSLLASCAMIAALLTGCALGHTHQAADAWEADLSEHWKLCSDCGETMEQGAHTPDDLERCTVCGAEVVDWGDSKSLYQYTEYGDLLKMADYDANGNVVTQTIYEYEYDVDGNMLHSSTLIDGVISDEYTYTVVNGESLTSEYTGYLEDGSLSVNYYDESGNCIRSVLYNSEGEIDLQTVSEHVLSADGEWYEAVCTVTEADGNVYVMEFSEMGDQTGRTHYDAEGNRVSADVWEYTYDEEGNWQTKTYYFNGVLTEEILFATVKSEDGSTTYPQTVTEYDESGAKIVTVYDENDQIVAETHYDANGNVLS